MPEIREALEERMARVEGILSQIGKRFDSLERRIDSLDKKFYWLIGIVLATWITTILTILFKG